MSIDNNFYLWSFAFHPLIQECAGLDEETFSYVQASHPDVAHFLDATRELRDAVELERWSRE